jgi:hypothetical protein
MNQSENLPRDASYCLEGKKYGALLYLANDLLCRLLKDKIKIADRLVDTVAPILSKVPTCTSILKELSAT